MIDLFDVQVGVLGVARGEHCGVSGEELLASMRRLKIARSLVRIAPSEQEWDLPASNAKLYEACEGLTELIPCPIVAPATGGDLPGEADQVCDAIGRGAAAVWIRPGADHWFIADWLSDALFEALGERQMPVFISATALSLAQLAELAGRFASLPIIYAEMQYRDQRALLPLLKRFANVRLSIGQNYRVFGGIRQIVEQVAPDRLLFGSGFPAADPMAAIAQLLYAEISDEHKQQIGSGNMDRLMEGIRR